MEIDENINGIIGGADGPTAVFYADKKNATIINKPAQKIKPIANIVKAVNDEQRKIYSVMERCFDFIINDDQFPEECMFTTDEPFHIIGVDGGGNCYGTIGGIGSLEDDIYPVGYVSHEGSRGRIASSLKEFMQLLVFYPFWYDLVQNHDRKTNVLAKELEDERIEFCEDYLENQKYIAEYIFIQKNNKSIELLFDNLRNKPKFKVYSIDEEQNDYTNLI